MNFCPKCDALLDDGYKCCICGYHSISHVRSNFNLCKTDEDRFQLLLRVVETQGKEINLLREQFSKLTNFLVGSF